MILNPCKKLGTFIDKLLDRQVEEVCAVINKHSNSISDVHGVLGNVVGTTDSQTITNKKFGTPPDYSEFEADGTYHAAGNATVWNDVNSSLVLGTSGASVPATIAFFGDAASVGQLKIRAFSGTNSTPDEMPVSLEVLHGYKEGSDVHLHIHWYPTDTNTGNVKWQVRYCWFNRGTAPSAISTASVVDAASGTAWKEQTSVIVLTGTNMNMGSRLIFCVFRNALDAQDTYAHNAAVSDIGLHYEIDTIGSRQIITK